MSLERRCGNEHIPLGWGILGTGNISYDFVRSLRKCEFPNTVRAVGGRSVKKAEEFASQFGMATEIATDYDGVINDPTVEVVYIGLANEAHAEWAMKAMDNLKHVLCEKPMAVNAGQVRAMVEKARQKGVFLMEGYWSRFFPSWQKLRSTIDSGELGRPQVVHANIAVGHMPPSCHSTEHGSTPLLAIGVYPIQFALWVFRGQRPSKVTAVGHKNTEGSDIWANITLEFPDGGHAVLYYNSTSHSPCNAFVGCEKGHLEIPDRMFGPTRLVKTVSQPEHKVEQFEFPLDDEQTYNYPNSSGLRYEADHVYECIRHRGAKECDLMSLEESQMLAEVLDNIRSQLGVVYPQDRQ